MTLDVSRLSGPDIVAALRSFGRRFRTTVAPTDDPETEEVAERVGPEGHDALDLVVHATNTFVLLGLALRQILVGDDPVLHPGVGDAGERDWEAPPGTTVAGALERLAGEAGTLADAVAEVHLPSDWARTGRVAGGGTVSALDVAREAARAGGDDLRRAGAVIAAVRTR